MKQQVKVSGTSSGSKAKPTFEGTPDEWIRSRPKDLVCNSSRYPYSGEPSLSKLKNSLITPNELLFIRNHGAVPKLKWDSFELEIKGLVDNPKKFSMDSLTSEFRSVTIPVTVACDGVRRKELNMIKPTRGGNMEAGAIGTSHWTGVMLCEVLIACGISADTKARHVHFTGADTVGEFNYGTSITLGHVLDPSNHVLLAYKMNGENLPPDHGYPLRVVIPGYVGSRCVKWLTSINVDENPSENNFHYYDNRVMPPAVSNTKANKENWWQKDETFITEFNVNSCIFSPNNDELLDLDKNRKKKYKFSGWAYAGGGRRILRVEVSLNEGKTWEYCELEHPESEIKFSEAHQDKSKSSSAVSSSTASSTASTPRTSTSSPSSTPRKSSNTPFAQAPASSLLFSSKSFTWCFWSILIDPLRFFSAQDIIVRAWDSAFNTQPTEPTWNLLGMMNNSCYKVKIQVQSEPHNHVIKFIHPVVPGALHGGWMTPQYSVDIDPNFPVKQFSPYTVEKHHKKKDCWITINNKVYDITDFLQSHPGGDGPILEYAGRDATDAFTQIHGTGASIFKEQFMIGIVEHKYADLELKNRPKDSVINPRKWEHAKLVKKHQVSPNTYIFTFKMDKLGSVGIPTGQHIELSSRTHDKTIVRQYTPIFPLNYREDDGTFEILAKIYFPCPKFPNGGKFTTFLNDLQTGDEVSVKGPLGTFFYHGKGLFSIGGHHVLSTKISLIAGGTGITPIYQLAKTILDNLEKERQKKDKKIKNAKLAQKEIKSHNVDVLDEAVKKKKEKQAQNLEKLQREKREDEMEEEEMEDDERDEADEEDEEKEEKEEEREKKKAPAKDKQGDSRKKDKQEDTQKKTKEEDAQKKDKQKKGKQEEKKGKQEGSRKKDKQEDTQKKSKQEDTQKKTKAKEPKTAKREKDDETSSTSSSSTSKAKKKIANQNNNRKFVRESDMQIRVIYCNHSVEDVLLRDELEKLAEAHSNFKIWFMVSSEPKQEKWPYGVGRITSEVAQKHLFTCKKGDKNMEKNFKIREPNVGLTAVRTHDCIGFVCGPPAMQEVCIEMLEKDCGYSCENLFEF